MNDYKIYPWPSLCILIFCVPCFLIWLKQCAFTFTVPLINKSLSQGSILINMSKNPFSCILIILFTYSNIISLFSSVCCQKISSYLISYKIFLKSEKRKKISNIYLYIMFIDREDQESWKGFSGYQDFIMTEFMTWSWSLTIYKHILWVLRLSNWSCQDRTVWSAFVKGPYT